MRGAAADAAGLLDFAFISFCSLCSSFFKAAKSDAVGGGADAMTAAATDGSGRGGGKRVEMGISVIERSNWRRYFLALE